MLLFPIKVIKTVPFSNLMPFLKSNEQQVVFVNSMVYNRSPVGRYVPEESSTMLILVFFVVLVNSLVSPGSPAKLAVAQIV